MMNHIRRVVAELLENFTTTKYGEITAYNPANYTVKVMLQPEGVETGFVPLEAIWVGNGFGAVFGPNVGDQVRLSFIDGRAQATVVGGRFFNNSAQAPVVQSGQGALVDSKGSTIMLNNDGTISISAPVAINSSAPTWNHTGKIVATGDVIANGISLDNHVHGGVQSGGSTTGAPQG